MKTPVQVVYTKAYRKYKTERSSEFRKGSQKMFLTDAGSACPKVFKGVFQKETFMFQTADHVALKRVIKETVFT